MLQRDCSRARQQRQTTLGPLALGLSEVSAANVSGRGRPFARFLCLGERVLRAATRERQTGTPSYELSRINGFASSFVVGRIARRTVKPVICNPGTSKTICSQSFLCEIPV